MSLLAGNNIHLVLVFLFSCFSIFCSANNNNAVNVKVTVRGAVVIASTDDNFICATLDWWPEDKCDFGQCPWGKAGILNLDLKNEILFKAIKAFNPLRIRIGGSLEDQVLYNVGKAIKSCPNFRKLPGGTFGFSRGCLEMQKWDQINEFMNDTGALVTFGLNALFGRSKLKGKDDYVGDWNPQNAEDFMKYTVSKGYKIHSYELGNELCGRGISGRVDAVQYAKDMQTLKHLVFRLYPDPMNQPKVLGPGGFYDETWFKTFLRVSGPHTVDGLTHHIYNLGSGRDPELIHRVMDPHYLDRVAQTYMSVLQSVRSFGPWSGAWVGESGGAYTSGGKDVSHTFANGFWYLDQLGMTATFDHKVFCRQSLIGGNYGLLNTTSFLPNPDYYGALLFHRLMGSKVLAVNHNQSPYLRAYAHCSKKKPGVSFMFINLDKSTTFNVSLVNVLNPNQGHGDTLASFKGNEAREEYHLTPLNGFIQSDVVLLNGTPLKAATRTFDIPEMTPSLVKANEPLLIGPHSFVFVTIRDLHAPACA
ncbi:hypothetical protein V2J09_012952 [Rumex salicifolius]